MDSSELQHYAKLIAKEHLQTFDYMGVFEILDGEDIEYEDADAEAIYELIIHADVTFKDDNGG